MANQNSKYGGVILDIFIFLLILTITFSIYRQGNPYMFPGIEDRLLMFTAFFGAISILFYLDEISRYLNKTGYYIKKIIGRISGKKLGLKIHFEKPQFKKRRLAPPKPDFEKFGDGAKFITEIARTCFARVCKWVAKNPFKSLFTAIIVFIYLYFLKWAYPLVSIDEFAFFILLAYMPISLKLRLDARYPVAVALFLLVVCAIGLAQGFENHANRLAIYAYYFLVISQNRQ